MGHDGRIVRTADLMGVVWRSFFIQASWSYDRMQSLGFAFALIPVLRRLYPDKKEYADRLAAHMEYFNTQPYLASFILGAAARLEEDRVLGRDLSMDPSEIKKSLMAPLGALGDSFFWGAFKPFAAAVSVAALFAGLWWAPFLFLILYNAVHVAVRISLVFVGYKSRGDAAELMTKYNFTRFARIFKISSLAVIGCMVGAVSAWNRQFLLPAPFSGFVLASAGAAFVIGLTALLRAGWSPVKLMFGLAALSMLLAWGGIG